jgi:L-ascorbate metabolism protein UlaG (beta-lactamase superfamily)
MRTGQDLIDSIDRTELDDNQMAFWWIGQHSFICKLAGKILYLDPFLSDNPHRTIPPMLQPEQIRHADVITGSHDHGDHIDRKVWPDLAVASPEATFLVPRQVLNDGLAGDLGIQEDRFAGLDDGDSFQDGALTITALPAAHERLEPDPETGRFRYLGFLIQAGPWRLYHAGDTTKYEGLETRLKQAGPIDLAFLPINGRDAERLEGGCIGNMTYQEAVDLAGECRIRLSVPAHYEMFAHNSEDPEKFRKYMAVKFPDVQPAIPEHGQRVLLGKSQGQVRVISAD